VTRSARRVLVAPDKYAGTLTAPQVAQAIADGWRVAAPGDELDLAPVSDGGPGFVDVTPGEVRTVTVSGPRGDPVPARLRVDGATAYVESAQACGLHLAAAAVDGTTYGVGELLRAALDGHARRVVVGLGGSGTNDGGAGMLAALGAVAVGPPGALRHGGLALARVEAVDLTGLDPRLGEVTLLAATDVDNPLLGDEGASAVFGPQKGATPEQVAALDAALAHWAALTDPRLAARPGAGAAGGLGFGLFLAGARREPGIALVLELLRVAERAARADLVITGEGRFDRQSLRGKATVGVAHAARTAGRPCLVLAGQVGVRGAEVTAAGVDAAYAVVDEAGSLDEALAHPAAHLAALAARAARTWSQP
jgi:glycerate kinase